MKTIDEVIDDFEKACDLERRCEDCSGCLGQEYGCPNDGAKSVPDALFYLKQYKSDKDELDSTRLAYLDVLNWTEQQTNPPLTWDELKAMEGKPVWVETDNVKFWTVVNNFRTICNQECLCCSKGYMCRTTYARGDWQAYRKERFGFVIGRNWERGTNEND